MKPDTCGDEYQSLTKYIRNHLPTHRLEFDKMPPQFKIYEEAAIIELPRSFGFKTNEFMKILTGRRSRRVFSPEALPLQDLSTLLKFTAGSVQDEIPDAGFAFRHVPSAGGLYPHETYIVAYNVDGLDPGLYHYRVPGHLLELLKAGAFGNEVEAIALDQAMARRCPACFFWTAAIPRSKWKYLQRCYRYVYIDIGHLGQNFYLVSEALGLACCAIGALYDDEGNDFLGIDGSDETLVYMGVVGKKR
jgi:SagB-type dehydrogenase family enzyme